MINFEFKYLDRMAETATIESFSAGANDEKVE